MAAGSPPAAMHWFRRGAITAYDLDPEPRAGLQGVPSYWGDHPRPAPVPVESKRPAPNPTPTPAPGPKSHFRDALFVVIFMVVAGVFVACIIFAITAVVRLFRGPKLAPPENDNASDDNGSGAKTWTDELQIIVITAELILLAQCLLPLLATGYQSLLRLQGQRSPLLRFTKSRFGRAYGPPLLYLGAPWVSLAIFYIMASSNSTGKALLNTRYAKPQKSVGLTSSWLYMWSWHAIVLSHASNAMIRAFPSRATSGKMFFIIPAAPFLAAFVNLHAPTSLMASFMRYVVGLLLGVSMISFLVDNRWRFQKVEKERDTYREYVYWEMSGYLICLGLVMSIRSAEYWELSQ